jgi:hypothetical protein
MTRVRKRSAIRVHEGTLTGVSAYRRSGPPIIHSSRDTYAYLNLIPTEQPLYVLLC